MCRASDRSGRQTYESSDASSLGYLRFGLADDFVGCRAVEGGFEGNAAQPSGAPQLQEGLLAAHQCQHGLHKRPAVHARTYIMLCMTCKTCKALNSI